MAVDIHPIQLLVLNWWVTLPSMSTVTWWNWILLNLVLGGNTGGGGGGGWRW